MEEKFETKGERTARIIRTIVRHLHNVSIRQLAADIGCNYMQLYYCSVGKTSELSDELIDCFRLSYPEFSKTFLRYGTGNLLHSDNSLDIDDEQPSPVMKDDNDLPFNIPDPAPIVNPIQDNGLSPIRTTELAALFNRILNLVNDLRTRESEIRDLKQELSTVQQRLARLEARLNEPQ